MTPPVATVAGLVLRNVVQTCENHPSQWEADADDGGKVVIRYRWGALTVGVGATVDAAVEAAVYAPAHHARIGGAFDGEIELGVVLDLTGMVLG